MKPYIKYVVLILSLTAAWIVCMAQETKMTVVDIPQEFQTHYIQLDSKLDEINNTLSTKWNGTKHPVVFSTELLAASTNRGEKVLDPQVFEAVKLNLNAFMALGVTGVSFDIKYPSIVPTYPRSDEYLEFYRKVTEEVRKRGFTLLIAMQNVFTDSIFGHLEVDFSTLTLDQYKEEKREYARTIINELHPDYLTLETEPTTQARNTGLDFSVENVADIVTYILDGLDRQTTLVGAGAGTWEDLAYIQSLAENTTIDYLDIHIYPIQDDLVIDRMETIQQIAKLYNLRIVIGESWLYKITDTELTDPNISYLDIFPRDVFDFWIPLDQKFIEMMAPLSHYIQSDFTSLFWMRYFWGYIPYNDTTRILGPTERYALVDQVTGQNMLAGNLNPTGQTYQNIIQENTGIRQLTNEVPEDLILHQNYPNPFNSKTTISFQLSAINYTELNIFNTLGQKVRTLIREEKPGGTYSVIWDGKDNAGNPVVSGVYVYHLKTHDRLHKKKMLLLE